MSAYADANVLASFYLDYDDEADVEAMLTGAEARKHWPLPVTTLLRLELANSLHRFVFETRHGGQWRVTPELSAIAWADFEEDLARGAMLRPVALTLEDVAGEFETLSTRHTMREGFRTYDLLHVASALILRCDTFWSFDKRALKLARIAGLKMNEI